MKRVQDALKGVVAAYQDAYRPAAKSQTQPDQYVVYTTTTIEDWHSDDECQFYRTYIYMNLWSMGDPTATARAIRAAMRGAGFAMDEESTGATTGDSYYAEGPNLFCVRWTWVLREAADDEP